MIGEVKLFPYKLRSYQRINDEDKVNRIDSVQYCRNEFAYDSTFRSQIEFTD